MMAHGFLKCYNIGVKDNGMANPYAEKILGHNVCLDESYYRLRGEIILEGNDRMLDYVSMIDHLIINDKNRLQQQVTQIIQERNQIKIMEEAHREELILQESIEKRFRDIVSRINTRNLD